MDDLLTEFLTETAESLEVIDEELVAFEARPNDRAILDNIFRLVHTIKGTCGFLGLPRLEAVAHAGETLLGRFRDGKLTVTRPAVSLVLESIDQIKSVLNHLEAHGAEPDGDDAELIARLEAAAEGELEGAAPAVDAAPALEETSSDGPPSADEGADNATGETLAGYDADLDRPLRPGEVSLAELEAAFLAADGPDLDALAQESEANQIMQAAVPAAAAPPAAAHAAGPETNSAGAPDADETQQRGVAQQSIRVNLGVLENLMTMVSELVLTRNQLMQMVRHSDDSEFKVPLQRLSNITGELQDAVMATRMQPIGNAWKKLPRIVRDCQIDVGKKIELVMEGQDTELDRQVLELIKDPLTHMVRNSCDHGIETPEDRSMTGKPETGTLRLHAYHEGGHILIVVSDDGAGLNTDKIRRKAIERGLVTEAEAAVLTENQVHRFIFHAGFSTAAQVTNLSGRGVGMDVVRTNIEQIGGAIDLHSVEGRGTTFTIKIPLTLAIVSALIVESGGSKFAIPQLAVLELVRVGATSDTQVETINETRVMRLRDRLLPLVELSQILGLEAQPKRADAAFVVVMQVGAQRFGVVVDDVHDTEEIVVKPLATMLRDIPTFSGNTILGDGSVIMILDPNGVAAAIGRASDEINSGAEREDDGAQARRETTTAMLVFRAGGTDPKAAPLSLVTRLEDIDVSTIERSNGRPVVQYRGALMPLVPIGEFGGAQAGLRDAGKQPVLVFTDRGQSAGLIVDEIVDIVDEQVHIEIDSEREGFVGTAVIRGQATEIIDVGHFLTQAKPDWFEGADEDSADQRGGRVLLVDDSAFFRNMMAPLLTAAGYEVVAVDSVERAWQLNHAGEDFDVIVTDIEMPNQSGFDFAAKLRDDPRWCHLPRVALSGRASADTPADLADAFVDFIPKSDRASLIATLAYTMKSQGEAA